jgi:hypothetical protein
MDCSSADHATLSTKQARLRRAHVLALKASDLKAFLARV